MIGFSGTSRTAKDWRNSSGRIDLYLFLPALITCKENKHFIAPRSLIQLLETSSSVKESQELTAEISFSSLLDKSRLFILLRVEVEVKLKRVEI